MNHDRVTSRRILPLLASLVLAFCSPLSAQESSNQGAGPGLGPNIGGQPGSNPVFECCSGYHSPFCTGSPQSYLCDPAPAAAGPVTLTLYARSDLDWSGESVEVRINGTFICDAFVVGATQCPSADNTAQCVVSEALFNSLVTPSGACHVEMLPTADVGCFCGGGGRIRVCLAYDQGGDCNNNGIPDACDVDCGTPGGPCDVPGCGTSQDCNGNGVPDECEVPPSPGCPSSGCVTGCASDCNENCVPDECDVSSGTSSDCNGNGVPDECELTGGFGDVIVEPDAFPSGTLISHAWPGVTLTSVPSGDVFATYSSYTSTGVHVFARSPTAGYWDTPGMRINFAGRPTSVSIDIVSDDGSDRGGLYAYDDNGSLCDSDVSAFLPTGQWETVTVTCPQGIAYAIARPTECCALLDHLVVTGDGSGSDCNQNGIPDECDITSGTSDDYDLNSVPDECEDCNGNGIANGCDVACATGNCATHPLGCGGFPDCNGNGIPDVCDIASGTTDDYDINGVPDVCEDCNGNGVADACDVACATGNCINAPLGCGGSSDCNNNALPDECEVPPIGPGPDCNGNAIPDDCEPDCNNNGIPDDCDIAAGSSADCQPNSIPDECDIDPTDPDGNGAVSPDCNANGIPDECDLQTPGAYVEETQCAPFWYSYPCVLVLASPPFANGDVTLTAWARTDLNSSFENVEVYIDGMSVGVLFDTSGRECPGSDDIDTLGVSAAVFNSALPGGVMIELQPSNSVNSFCSASFVRVQVSYQYAAGSSGDCNGNGVPDECDVPPICDPLDPPPAGCSDDYDANLLPDECDPDCNANGVPDACDLDCGTGNCANHPSGCRSSEDCNENVIPDDCDVDPTDPDGNGLVSDDCNGNVKPDECELNLTHNCCDWAHGTGCTESGIEQCVCVIDPFCCTTDWDRICFELVTSSGCGDCYTDCNGNGVLDECDVSSGASPDCNVNGIPDECDIDPNDPDGDGGISADINANGVPDECEDCDADGLPDDCELDCGQTGGPCDVAGCGGSRDCNHNSLPDECDIAAATSADCNGNGVPDECDLNLTHNCCERGHGAGCSEPSIEACVCAVDPYCCNDEWDRLCTEMVTSEACGDCNVDCNGNGILDECEIAGGTGDDCNSNGILDECDIGAGSSPDCNGNGIPDECDIGPTGSGDCNANGVPDECDIANGTSQDVNGDGVPDECNHAPVCDVGGVYDVACGGPTTAIPLDGSASMDPDGNPLTYLWETDCPGGSFDDTGSPTPLLTVVTSPGCSVNCTVTLTVTDDLAATDSCSEGVDITDATVPTLSGPGDLTVECDESTDPANTGEAVALDVCDPIPSVVFTDTVEVGSCPQEAVIMRSWTATDACGNAAMAELQVITIEDSVAPTLTCPADATVTCGDSTAPGDTGMAAATDNCDPTPVVTLSETVTTPPCASDPIQYVIERVWEAGDACGNTSSCAPVQTVTVLRQVHSGLIIKQGACPAPLNRESHGVLPVVLPGDGGLSVAEIDLSSVRLSRADCTAGSSAPNDGPPGPTIRFLDLNHPYDGLGPCSCNINQSSDGLADLVMHFRTDDLVAALGLSDVAEGAVVEVVLSGRLMNGCEFIAADCIQVVPPGGGWSSAVLAVESNVPTVWIDASPLDNTLDGGGFPAFERHYPLTTTVTLVAEPTADGHPFLGWIVDGAMHPQAHKSDTSLEFMIDDVETVRAVYDTGQVLPPAPAPSPPPSGGPGPTP